MVFIREQYLNIFVVVVVFNIKGFILAGCDTRSVSCKESTLSVELSIGDGTNKMGKLTVWWEKKYIFLIRFTTQNDTL